VNESEKVLIKSLRKKEKVKAKLPLNFHASPITHKIELFDQSFYYEVWSSRDFQKLLEVPHQVSLTNLRGDTSFQIPCYFIHTIITLSYKLFIYWPSFETISPVDNGYIKLLIRFTSNMRVMFTPDSASRNW